MRDDGLLQRLRAMPDWDESWLQQPGTPSKGSGTTDAAAHRSRRIAIRRQ
jgi:hypothetical protein